MPYIPPSPSRPQSSPSAEPTPVGPAPRVSHGRHNSYPSLTTLSQDRASRSTSSSSSSYLHRHRRSPTICAHVSELSNAYSQAGASRRDHPQHRNSWNSSGPGNGFNGALLSPPESTENSGDENQDSVKDKTKDSNMEDLQVPVMAIDHQQKFQGFANEDERMGNRSTSPPASPSSDSMLLCQVPELATQTPDQSDGEDDSLANKPLMLRKKSGELVRPALRSSRKKRPISMPGTPTFSKAVHFGAQLEEVRHFLQLDRPLAVSAGSSPVEEYDGDSEFPFGLEDTPVTRPPFEWEARVINFPSPLGRDLSLTASTPIKLERIFLSSDNKRLVGVVAVANLGYQKHVTARFTLDYWKTISEVSAEYNDAGGKRKAGQADEYDRFNFNIRLSDLANLDNRAMFICIRYSVNGMEFWDNNDSMDYHVQFSRKHRPHGKQDALSQLRNAKPNTRPSAVRPPSFDDLDVGLTSFPVDLSATIELELSAKSPTRAESLLPDSPTRRNKAGSNALADRYDFSSSLSTVRPYETNRASNSTNNIQPRESGNPVTVPTTAAPNAEPVVWLPPGAKKISDFMSDRPNHQSPIYQELVDKYCFFGSVKQNQTLSRDPKPSSTQGSTGKVEEVSSSPSETSSAESSPASSPVIEKAHPIRPINQYPSRSSSRSPTHSGPDVDNSRGGTPVMFTYPFRQALSSPLLSESHTRQVIRG
ncbi:hypothetical protein FQN57_003060 [Myotisia sp. PD_48]|nr:hypothetical protein FQN57_003060 [Myotisia sp. PD_48]